MRFKDIMKTVSFFFGVGFLFLSVFVQLVGMWLVGIGWQAISGYVPSQLSKLIAFIQMTILIFSVVLGLIAALISTGKKIIPHFAMKPTSLLFCVIAFLVGLNIVISLVSLGNYKLVLQVKNYEDATSTYENLFDQARSPGGSFDRISDFVTKGGDINATNSRGQTFLHCASHAGHRMLVEFLINRGADIDAKDVVGRTPLILAASCGHTEIVRLLLSAGTDINVRSNRGYTALMWATDMEYQEIAKLLRSLD